MESKKKVYPLFFLQSALRPIEKGARTREKTTFDWFISLSSKCLYGTEQYSTQKSK